MDASLTIEWLPATYQCFACPQHFENCELADRVACPECGEVALEIGHQDVYYVSTIDVSVDNEKQARFVEP